ncbi:sulfurtransferase [Aestuariibius sp. 2305UL40-4]|uniref:sulfurtransferase n=1 Tax=Aestuariibius violaceus TaxID=3234132 RepID=UPI00345E1E38
MAQGYDRPVAFHSTISIAEATLEAPEEEQIDLRPLISPAELVQLMEDASPQVIDIRNPSAIRPLFSYAAGHVPGSINVPYGDWRKLWADPLSIPAENDLTDFIRAAGLTRDRPVVIVHSSAAKGNFGSAAWVYWLLKTAGFEQLAILNGGIRSWKASGQELSTDPTPIVPSFEVATLNTSWLATHEDVDAVLAGQSEAQLLDARPLQQIARDASLHGSFTMDATSLITGEDGQAGEVLDIFMRVKAADLTWEFGDVITYCNNGALAAVDWFMASEIAGIPNVRVYGHSLSARNRRITALR